LFILARIICSNEPKTIIIVLLLHLFILDRKTSIIEHAIWVNQKIKKSLESNEHNNKIEKSIDVAARLRIKHEIKEREKADR